MPTDRTVNSKNNSAVYVVCRDRKGEQQTFRVGVPTTWEKAQDRWLRIDDARRAKRKVRVRFNRRWYQVDWVEVRSVDRHGRGLGSLRHGLAFLVPCAAVSIG